MFYSFQHEGDLRTFNSDAMQIQLRKSKINDDENDDNPANKSGELRANNLTINL